MEGNRPVWGVATCGNYDVTYKFIIHAKYIYFAIDLWYDMLIWLKNQSRLYGRKSKPFFNLKYQSGDGEYRCERGSMFSSPKPFRLIDYWFNIISHYRKTTVHHRCVKLATFVLLEVGSVDYLTELISLC